MKRSDILNDALNLTMGDRNKDYGDPFKNHLEIARLANAMDPKLNLTASQVVMVHIATKLSRAHVSPLKVDHYVDIAAYAAILGECREAEAQPWGAHEDPLYEAPLERAEDGD